MYKVLLPNKIAEQYRPAMPALRHILVTDTPIARDRDGDVVVWLGRGEVPSSLAAGKLVIEPSSLRAAAIYVASAPAELHLALARPLEFVSLLLEVDGAPALRAA
jgi:hypothetical protein